ncbi:response regulator transcription factor [Paludibaculum fermentans]|uniref:Response regulator transcription factor n=1 Tax=Paludibaculum fermentans TaxID=1473598 RepID=A0A7S7NK43_PALFE|nr:response regulator transcription factor [Paludibaculum fermentans]QOY85113.1 response regulator transcription factor [Paludibaculum fermentans]
MRLLLVEDEQDAARMLAKGLREQTYAVDIAFDGDAAIEKLSVNTYDLVILDIMLPGRNGFEICREMRRMGAVAPVLMLTAQDQVWSRIEGLDSGADDYLTKPFDFGELSARIRALLRRGPALQDPVLRVANLTLDTRNHSVRRGDRSIDFTAKEYALLEYLSKRQGEVVTRPEISEHVWDESYDPFSNLIEVYIQRLRRKVDTSGESRLIHTRRGEGYRIGGRDEDD